MLSVENLIADLKSVVVRTEILLIEQRLLEIEQYQLGTEILESMLGYQIGD